MTVRSAQPRRVAPSYATGALASAYADTPVENTGQGGTSVGKPSLFYTSQPPALQSEINFGAIPGLPNLSNYRDDMASVQHSIYNQGASRLDPMFANRETQMNEQLAARGNPAGSSANVINRDQFGRDVSDAYNQLFQQSNLAGRQEHSRLFGLGMQSHQQGLRDQLAAIGVGNQARQQAFGEQMSTRQQMFSELSNFLSQSQFNPNSYLPPAPSGGGEFGGGVSVPGTYQANAGQYQAPGFGQFGAAVGNQLYNYYQNPNNANYVQPGTNYTPGVNTGTNTGNVYGP